MNDNDRQSGFDRLALEVLNLSKNTLLVHMRFFDAAMNELELVKLDDSPLMTDGKHMLYCPKAVLTAYKDEKETVLRNYLHILLHCIFLHMYNAFMLDSEIWDIACDIAVESAITDFGLKSATVKREFEQKKVIDKLKTKIGNLTAERLYRYFRGHSPGPSEMQTLVRLFSVDSHSLWYVPEKNNPDSDENQNDSSGNSSTNNPDNKKSPDAEIDDSKSPSSPRDVQKNEWKRIAERMQVDIETSKHYGTNTGFLTQNLKEVNRERYDYTAFLKKFAVRCEVMKINDDEFDYIFYTYGLERYGNMPLVEPLEYKEDKKIREFVIAIDTSGSVQGDKVQAFVQKTYNILKSTESFASRINLHIMQCDTDIKEHVKITSQTEFDNWINNAEIKGLGGTDFRPVFSEVNRLIDNKEFTNLKGLIYFTDGYGTFPERKPDYETAFVFVSDGYNNPSVPSWAIKLVLDKEEI